MWSKTKVRVMLVAGLLVLGIGRVEAGVEVGDMFPRLAEFALEGDVPEHAGKILVVDFWASWCAPCKASFPAYNALHDAWRERGVVILAVSVDKRAAAYRAFVERMAPRFATVRDEGQALVSRVEAPAMPTSYLVDRSGRVRFVHRGFFGERTVRELNEQLRQLTEEES